MYYNPPVFLLPDKFRTSPLAQTKINVIVCGKCLLAVSILEPGVSNFRRPPNKPYLVAGTVCLIKRHVNTTFHHHPSIVVIRMNWRYQSKGIPNDKKSSNNSFCTNVLCCSNGICRQLQQIGRHC